MSGNLKAVLLITENAINCSQNEKFNLMLIKSKILNQMNDSKSAEKYLIEMWQQTKTSNHQILALIAQLHFKEVKYESDYSGILQKIGMINSFKN